MKKKSLRWVFTLIPLVIGITGFLIAKENIGALTNYKDVMAAFADPVIMLLLGGFVLAFAATKVGLDVQLAKVMLKPFGTNPKTVLLGILLVIGIFSMFMSNTATAAMMLTFLTPVLATLPKDGGGRISLALAIPIAANIGGMGTPIVISVIFFVIYYVISLSGEKMAKEGTWSSFTGIWISSFILTPIAIYLMIKATNDSSLLDTDWYDAQFKKIKKKLLKS